MFNTLRDRFTNFMQMRAVHRHGSRVGWRIARKYTRYLEECRARFSEPLPPAGELAQTVADFRRDGIASFWTPETAAIATSIHAKIQAREGVGKSLWGEPGASGNRNYQGDAYIDFPELEKLFRGPLGTFLTNYYRTYFKTFYASMLKSVRVGETPSGSQLWHSDSGPGTCVVVAFYLHDVLDEGAGVLHALPWKQSMEIYEHEYDALLRMARQRGIILREASKDTRRELMTTYYQEAIDATYRDKIRGPKGKAGLVVPFLNNTLHYGGYPVSGRERIALLAHCYPSDRPTDFEHYRRHGMRKTAPCPMDPAAPF